MSTLRAAIYTRKSTKQEATDERELSTARQEADCRAYCQRKGWDVVSVYDEGSGVSGTLAEEDRPELKRLMTSAGTFDVLVAWNEDRVSREGIPYLYLLHRLEALKVKVFYADKDREAKIEEFGDIILETVNAGRSREHARATSKDTKAGLKKKAELGYVVGSAVYGYDNRRTGTHTERVLNQEQAAIVARIFTHAADGWGARRIARALNAAKIPHAHADHQCSAACQHAPGKYKGWAASTVRAMLRNQIYTGAVIYRGERLNVTVPRIIGAELWDRVQAQSERTRRVFSGKRSADGRLSGRPEAPVGTHLLTGLMVCGGCGGNMIAIARSNKKGGTRRYYVCASSYKRGADCPNRHAVPYDRLHAAVLDHFKPMEADVWFAMVRAETERWMGELQAQAGQAGSLRADVARLDLELSRLSEAIAHGGNVPALVTAIQGRQRERDEQAARLEQAEGQGFGLPDLENVLAVIHSAHNGLSGVLKAGGEEGRRVLRTIITEPLVIRPTVDADGQHSGWEWQGTAELGRIITGQIGRVTKVSKRCGSRSTLTRPAVTLALHLVGRLAAA